MAAVSSAAELIFASTVIVRARMRWNPARFVLWQLVCASITQVEPYVK